MGYAKTRNKERQSLRGSNPLQSFVANLMEDGQGIYKSSNSRIYMLLKFRAFL